MKRVIDASKTKFQSQFYSKKFYHKIIIIIIIILTLQNIIILYRFIMEAAHLVKIKIL